ncbi:MAG: hypothetical protein JWO52_6781 [Gammaproteobacteria bacterium]|nr:hypothetical protein [Gammaproteobacteria bacterium]
MLTILQLTTLFLIALTMACAVAHALELPGKMRLPKEVYLSVQPIYYPGFTVVGGFAEFGALLMLFALLFLTPREGPTFALTLWAFIALLSLQGIFARRTRCNGDCCSDAPGDSDCGEIGPLGPVFTTLHERFKQLGSIRASGWVLRSSTGGRRSSRAGAKCSCATCPARDAPYRPRLPHPSGNFRPHRAVIISDRWIPPT